MTRIREPTPGPLAEDASGRRPGRLSYPRAITDTHILLLTLVLYLLALLGLGIAAQRRTRDDADFFLGGRRAGALVSAIGASASSSSAWTLLGVSGAAYAWGLSAVWLFPACVGGFVFNWLVIAPAVSRASHDRGALTAVELLSGPPGAAGRGRIVAVAAVVILVSMGAYVASQFQGAGKTFEAVFDVPPWQSVSLGAAIVLAYTALGGFSAVSWTDTVQGLVMVATAVALPVAALIEVGGPAGLADALADADPGYLSLGGPRPLVAGIGFAAGLVGIGLGYPGQPHVLKYFMAMDRDPAVVRRARAIAIAWAALVFAGMILLGLCGRALMPTLGDKETVFVAVAGALFHPAVAGVMLAAVLSAMMSTADSQLLVASSTITHDIGLGRGEANTGSRSSLGASRLAVAALTIGAAGAALVGSDEIFSRVLFGWSAMGAAFGPLFIVTVALGRALPPARVFAIMLLGFVLAVAAHTAYGELGLSPHYKNIAIHIAPFAISLTAALAVSRPRSTLQADEHVSAHVV